MAAEGTFVGSAPAPGSWTDLIGGRDPFELDAVDLPVEIAGSDAWWDMEVPERGRVLGGLLRNVVRRAVASVPLYRSDAAWRAVRVDDIADISDLASLPLVAKDTVPGTSLHGVRDALRANPYDLVPEDLGQVVRRQERANARHADILRWYGHRMVLSFHSRGSQGGATRTLDTYLTVEMEAHALARCLRRNGFRPGQRVACLAPPGHKLGLLLARAALLMGMPFHGRETIMGTLENIPCYAAAFEGVREAASRHDDAAFEHHAARVRQGIREYFRAHGIRVVEAVECPTGFAPGNREDAPFAFIPLYDESPGAFAWVEHVLLSGIPVPHAACGRILNDGKPVSTVWSPTEAAALATGAAGAVAPSDDPNDLSAAWFPNVGFVAMIPGSPAGPVARAAAPGETGPVAVTGFIGGGSTYLNHVIGDVATSTREGFRDIARAQPSPGAGGGPGR